MALHWVIHNVLTYYIVLLMLYRLCCIASTRPLKNMVKKICLGDFLVDYFTKSYQQNQNGVSSLD
ncbi:hypothetical protein AXE82_05250 [Moraxella osloensis]|nr:hypothetical protein AXE82_05250 [Moraxella osloensis]